MFSARVCRKLLTVSALAPMFFSSSAMMADLSAPLRVGASRMVASLGSLANRAPSRFRALEVGSRDEVLTAAVYCWAPK